MSAKDAHKADINKALKDIMAGKTAVSVMTNKLRGKAIVLGGAGTATRTVGLLGGVLTYAFEAGIIIVNPAHGLRKPIVDAHEPRRGVCPIVDRGLKRRRDVGHGDIGFQVARDDDQQAVAAVAQGCKLHLDFQLSA